jgi:hypothetical protein
VICHRAILNQSPGKPRKQACPGSTVGAIPIKEADTGAAGESAGLFACADRGVLQNQLFFVCALHFVKEAFQLRVF